MRQISGDIKCIHNGMDVRIFDTMEDVNSYINSVISKYARLDPRKIMDRKLQTKGKGFNTTQIIRYRYNTLYEEIFVLEYYLV